MPFAKEDHFMSTNQKERPKAKHALCMTSQPFSVSAALRPITPAGSGLFKRALKKEGRLYPPPFGCSMLQFVRFRRHSAAYAASPAKLTIANPIHKPAWGLSPVAGMPMYSSTFSVKTGLTAVP